MARLNCWQVMDCGREPGGRNADEQGVCPAATESRLDGVNHGDRGGRACWVAAGVLSSTEMEATSALHSLCVSCPFYERVITEEGREFVFSPEIVATMKRVDPRACGRVAEVAKGEKDPTRDSER